MNAYPDWLRRDTAPERSFIMFSLLLYLAIRLRDNEFVQPSWNMDEETAERYAERLHRDPALRAKAATAVGTTLENFDERAPDILGSTPGMGMFPETRRVGQMLRTGKWA